MGTHSPAPRTQPLCRHLAPSPHSPAARLAFGTGIAARVSSANRHRAGAATATASHPGKPPSCDPHSTCTTHNHPGTGGPRHGSPGTRRQQPLARLRAGAGVPLPAALPFGAGAVRREGTLGTQGGTDNTYRHHSKGEGDGALPARQALCRARASSQPGLRGVVGGTRLRHRSRHGRHTQRFQPGCRRPVLPGPVPAPRHCLKVDCSSLKAAFLCFSSSACFFFSSCSALISSSKRLASWMACTYGQWHVWLGPPRAPHQGLPPSPASLPPAPSPCQQPSAGAEPPSCIAILRWDLSRPGVRLTLASKKLLAPFTPSVETSISESRARACSPLSSCSSPAAALRKISRNCEGRRWRQLPLRPQSCRNSLPTFLPPAQPSPAPLPARVAAPPAPHLPKAELAVQVFVHFLDHVLQAQVRLRRSQLLHHQLQLHQVDEAILSCVVPVGRRHGPVTSPRGTERSQPPAAVPLCAPNTRCPRRWRSEAAGAGREQQGHGHRRSRAPCQTTGSCR